MVDQTLDPVVVGVAEEHAGGVLGHFAVVEVVLGGGDELVLDLFGDVGLLGE